MASSRGRRSPRRGFRRLSARGWILIGLTIGVLAVAALPPAMLVLSRLPAERAYQRCAEQPDVTKCHDPLTSWLP